MSDNKFIKHLRGENTAKSVLEIKNQRTTTSFANMPEGTSNANDVYSDHRGDAAGVLKGTENWKLNNSVLVETSSVYGDGRDFTDSFDIDGNGLWVNATHTFATARRFAPNTKFVLKLCGHDLNTVVGDTIGFTLLVKFGTNDVISKTFNITEQAFDFCKEFVIDFAESNSSAIKITAGDTMQVQLLCSDASAQAVIYNGMTVFTALQRRVDGDVVASDKKTFDEVVQDIDDINDEIDQIHEDIDDLEDYVDDTFVRLDGESIMTGPLKMRATSSFQCAIAPFWDGVGFYKLNSDNSVTLIASIETPDGFIPWVTDTYNIGSSLKKWKNLYLSGKAYVSVINNGYDIAVPVTNSADTLALVNADINPLQQQINHLQTIGRFLSFWDATTGLAQTNPQTSPYVYQPGDYFRVGVVAGPGGTNYKPSGSSYVIGQSSTTVETERLSVGQVYYYDGANWALAAGGNVAIDETTITFNNNDEIQAVATVNQNTAASATNPVYDWVGTLAEYNAQNIATLHPEWVCFITDDFVGGDSVYTKTQIDNMFSNMLNAIWPVGSTYIGTQNTCPMAALIPNSTWTLVAQNRALWGGNGSNANTTIAAGLPNITASWSGSYFKSPFDSSSGAGTTSGSATFYDGGYSHPGANSIGFDASRSNSIYGSSTTVQPPAYIVNIWRRTA